MRLQIMEVSSRTRPQDLVFTLLGRHVYAHNVTIATSSIIRILERLDISEHATRSAVSRMVKREYLRSERQGRQSFLSMTSRSHAIVREGTPRIFEHPPLLEDPDPGWTLLGFSIPEARRRERHMLRVRLKWLGFAPLRDGLWVAAGRVDVEGALEELGLAANVHAFHAATIPPTGPRELVREAWDLEALRSGFAEFLERWGCEKIEGADVGALETELLLITEWRLLVLDTPRLPARELPLDWPAMRAHEQFLRVHNALRGRADAEFAALAALAS